MPEVTHEYSGVPAAERPRGWWIHSGWGTHGKRGQSPPGESDPFAEEVAEWLELRRQGLLTPEEDDDDEHRD